VILACPIKLKLKKGYFKDLCVIDLDEEHTDMLKIKFDNAYKT
jgi:hypothetical protein